ncbi:MAG: hypothetical protein KQH63_19060 [Desulfobulbaceae bacterium]|nr:hypothetical protein [Desulfobulbaceae bacterium]
MFVGRALKKMQEEFTDLTVEEVEVTTNPLLTLRHGIKMIPTLVAGSKRLSGFILNKNEIRRFIRELYDSN